MGTASVFRMAYFGVTAADGMQKGGKGELQLTAADQAKQHTLNNGMGSVSCTHLSIDLSGSTLTISKKPVWLFVTPIFVRSHSGEIASPSARSRSPCTQPGTQSCAYFS